jgi:hypothetical protein
MRGMRRWVGIFMAQKWSNPNKSGTIYKENFFRHDEMGPHPEADQLLTG